MSLTDPGNGLLLACLACSGGAALLSVPRLSGLSPGGTSLPKPLMAAAFASATAALALLAYCSLSPDFRYLYVWEHSSSDLATVYRLSAVWAGGGGSLLLCAWLMSLVAVVESFVRGPDGVGTGFRSAFGAVMSALVAFFAISTAMSGVFDRTPDASLAAHPDGLGMDVLLQTPEMALHAPLIFVAYAALGAVFSASVAYHLTGDRLWYRVGLPWGRLAWLTLTAGIGLGAVWAYYVIGWGGYWSWDPVETSSLVPWFMATAFLHTQLRHTRRGEHLVTSPMFGMLSFVGVAFVSFVVRAGGLWRSSVHDYGAAAGPSALSRLSELLREEPSLVGTLAFVLVLAVVASLLSYRAVRRAGPQQPSPRPRRLSEYITDQNVMFLALTLLALSALVSVALMLKSINYDQAATFAEMDQKMTVVMSSLMVALGLCLVWRTVGRERAFPLSLGVVGASVASAVMAGVTGALPFTVAFAVPPSLYALIASAVRLSQSVAKGPVRTRAFRAGAQVAHIGVALVLMAYVVSSGMQAFPEQGAEVVVPVGGHVTVGDYDLSLVALTVSDDVSGYPAGVDQVRMASFEVREGGRLVAGDARLEVLYSYDPATGYSVLERVAFVESSLSGDLYMSFEWMTDSIALVHAKVVPAMSMLWTGALLLLVGVAMRLFAFAPPDHAAA